MPYVLRADEVLSVGLRIEENGRDFYAACARIVKDSAVRETFAFLTTQEQQHIAHFRAIMRSGGSYKPPIEVAEEEAAFARALADGSIFTPSFTPEMAAAQAEDESAALHMAIGVEKDSIIFYSHMEGFVPPTEQEAVRELRRQEEMHLRLLTERLTELPPRS